MHHDFQGGFASFQTIGILVRFVRHVIFQEIIQMEFPTSEYQNSSNHPSFCCLWPPRPGASETIMAPVKAYGSNNRNEATKLVWKIPVSRLEQFPWKAKLPGPQVVDRLVLGVLTTCNRGGEQKKTQTDKSKFLEIWLVVFLCGF